MHAVWLWRPDGTALLHSVWHVRSDAVFWQQVCEYGRGQIATVEWRPHLDDASGDQR